MKTETLKEFMELIKTIGTDPSLENTSLLSTKLQEHAISNSSAHADLVSLFLVTLGSGAKNIVEIKSVLALREQANESSSNNSSSAV